MNQDNFSISFFLLLMGTFLLSFGILGKNNDSKKAPQTVYSVDLKRYAGLWYEIAKVPNRFQKKCFKNTSAEYKIRSDGRIDVINRCLKTDGKAVVTKGIAKVTDTRTNSKLKVSFVRFLGLQLFWADYWIIGLDKNYKYAVVGDPKRKYGWILSRKKNLNPAEWDEIYSILEENGYDRKRFILTKQTL